jgi:hypothetical protein
MQEPMGKANANISDVTQVAVASTSSMPASAERRQTMGYRAAEFITAFGDVYLVHRDEVVGRLQRHACRCGPRVRPWWNGASWCR